MPCTGAGTFAPALSMLLQPVTTSFHGLRVMVVLVSLPDADYAVRVENRIGAHQRDTLHQRLRGEQTVERVTMMTR